MSQGADSSLSAQSVAMPQSRSDLHAEVHPSKPLRTLRAALLGNPNCGKTALFNLLTGARQKVANYAGVTVERKEGWLHTKNGQKVRLLDLPGTYSLHAHSEDERIARDVVTGSHRKEAILDVLICVLDATRLQLNLRLVLEARDLKIPMLVVLNMSDMAQRQGIKINQKKLGEALGLPVVESVGVRSDGAVQVLQWLDEHAESVFQAARNGEPVALKDGIVVRDQLLNLHLQVSSIMDGTVVQPAVSMQRDDRIDAVVLHPIWGALFLLLTLFLMFQAVFSWAEPFMEGIEALVGIVGDRMSQMLPDGVLSSLLVDGIIAGTGAVVIFLPQILILFFFILILEDCGYLPRAAFLLDRMMGTVGLSGRSFIPLLSSFACAVPGIMATRSISSWRDRLLTIMIAL